MNSLCFVIKDMSTQTFFKPLFQPSIVQAKREFTLMVNEGDSMVAKFPTDFRLFVIGEFDATKGVLIPRDVEDLGAAIDYLKKPDPVLPFDKARA